jgi:hypothetical protein
MYYLGDKKLMGEEKALILNSRQSKIPTGADQWIQNSFRAVQEAIARGHVIISSIGMNTWEFLVWAAGYNLGRQIIVVPVDGRDDEYEIKADIIRDFGLEESRTGFMFFRAVKKGIRAKSAWAERDRIAVSLANQIYPISIRKGGNLERMFKNNPAKISTAQLAFSTDYNPHIRRSKVAIREEELTACVRGMKWDYLTHYTRTAHAPWPGETSADFYRAIYDSCACYPRTALETLKRIVSDKQIWASYYHIRGGHKVVSFTELHPREAINLIKWRPRYVRWNFEPYGIAINKTYALSMGVRPVIYEPPEKYYELADEDKPFYQNPGEKGGEWEPEKEWRHHGNLDLTSIPPQNILLLVRNKSDAFKSDFQVLHLAELG